MMEMQRGLSNLEGFQKFAQSFHLGDYVLVTNETAPDTGPLGYSVAGFSDTLYLQ